MSSTDTDSADLLKALCRNRGNIKARISRFTKYISKLESQETLSQAARIELTERINKFRSDFEEIEQVQGRIENSVSDSNLDSQYEIREELENLYYELLSKAEAKMCESQPRDTSPAHSVNSDQRSGSARTLAGASVDNLGIKLPTIELAKFNGRYECWLEFKEVFESLIHSNDTITNVQKFHYLRASLSDDAAEVIRCIDFSGQNYSMAWQALIDRYDNSKLLVHNHIREIIEQPNVSRDSFTQIRSCVDNISKNIKSLKNLGEAADQWDTLLIYLISSKLDKALLRDWESSKGLSGDNPTLQHFLDFLKHKADLLETFASKNMQTKSFIKHHKVNVASRLACYFCKGNHSIYKCKDFVNLSIGDRILRAQELQLCQNCLCMGHSAETCRKQNCKKCNAKHNTLLHAEHVNVAAASNVFGATGLLATAYVNIVTDCGKIHRARTLLDCGSQSCIITQSCAKRLNLKCSNADVSIVGIGSHESRVAKKCNINFMSIYSDKMLSVECLLTKSITGVVPGSKVDLSNVSMPYGLQLADPNFNDPAEVDVLLGASIFWDLLGTNRVALSETIYLHETRLGWIVIGNLPEGQRSVSICNLVTTAQLDRSLSRFWELEDVAKKRCMSAEERLCENNFVKTTKRGEDGKFVVTIPFKDATDMPILGESRSKAVRQFYSLERKFLAKPEFKADYCKFMKDYREKGHMSLLISSDRGEGYYMPHHGVQKLESATTKLRVVFNASCPTNSNVSYNDAQLVGPTIQEDLYSIMVRFRQYQYVLCADIEGMYRQVWVDPTQRKYQRIVWRESPDDELQDYELNTVTYGTASAPYLAIRCLYQLGVDCEESHPEVSRVIKSDFYVDDLVTGAESVEDLSDLAANTQNVLAQAGFNLRKWRSNCMLNIRGQNVVIDESYIFGKDTTSKMLGVHWNSVKDVFVFRIRDVPSFANVSKRNMLAEISAIFDPLGLLGAVTISLKIFMQQLWLSKITWDDVIEGELKERWVTLRSQLCTMNNIEIPRCISCPNSGTVQLHGFADASETAFACCIYLRTIDANGKIYAHLICSKSRVAPIKRQTIPKLELCAALLVAELMEVVLSSLRLNISAKYYWSDSTIVLHWVKMVPTRLETFVANRVSKIQTLTNTAEWRHVSGADNPADMVSRGVEPGTLLSNSMWWRGPDWLTDAEDSWPVTHVELGAEIPGLRKSKLNICTTVICVDRFSTLQKLQRVTAYVLRFVHNCKVKKSVRVGGHLSVTELERAMVELVKISQRETFEREIKSLRNAKLIKSRIKSLAPYLDNSGILRVGGRLKNVDLPPDSKNPILLSAKHYFTKLYFKREHERLMHSGPQSLLYSVRERFWPLGGRTLARAIVHKCIKCFRMNANNVTPVMGNLPEARIRPSLPFTHVGVDFAGPFQLKDRMGRGAKLYKSYVCLFICFASKAMHLEVVTSLTAEAFIATFRRFCARRGMPSHVYSDNGTNFTGAWRELGQFIKNNAEEISVAACSDNVSWHFIPPRSPHFGGLWERGVRSVKHHLRRVIGNLAVTYEHFVTILVQIEAILNSRPLSPMSTDPHDLEALTPAHLIMGKAVTSIPDPDVKQIKENRRNLFQTLQAVQQHFWTRWTREFVAGLQERQKWQRPYEKTLQIDTLVLIKDEQTSPLEWKLGRVVNVVCGSDGVGRVADIKTESGVIRRSFAKICPLPLEG